MTRRRRNTINGPRRRSQMPRDTDLRANIERLDAQKKTRHDEAIIAKLRADRAERQLREAQEAMFADVIIQGRKQPKTWDEINSNRAGGVDRY